MVFTFQVIGILSNAFVLNIIYKYNPTFISRQASTNLLFWKLIMLLTYDGPSTNPNWVSDAIYLIPRAEIILLNKS